MRDLHLLQFSLQREVLLLRCCHPTITGRSLSQERFDLGVPSEKLLAGGVNTHLQLRNLARPGFLILVALGDRQDFPSHTHHARAFLTVDRFGTIGELPQLGNRIAQIITSFLHSRRDCCFALVPGLGCQRGTRLLELILQLRSRGSQLLSIRKFWLLQSQLASELLHAGTRSFHITLTARKVLGGSDRDGVLPHGQRTLVGDANQRTGFIQHKVFPGAVLNLRALRTGDVHAGSNRIAETLGRPQASQRLTERIHRLRCGRIAR